MALKIIYTNRDGVDIDLALATNFDYLLYDELTDVTKKLKAAHQNAVNARPFVAKTHQVRKQHRNDRTKPIEFETFFSLRFGNSLELQKILKCQDEDLQSIQACEEEKEFQGALERSQSDEAGDSEGEAGLQSRTFLCKLRTVLCKFSPMAFLGVISYTSVEDFMWMLQEKKLDRFVSVLKTTDHDVPEQILTKALRNAQFKMEWAKSVVDSHQATPTAQSGMALAVRDKPDQTLIEGGSVDRRMQTTTASPFTVPRPLSGPNQLETTDERPVKRARTSKGAFDSLLPPSPTSMQQIRFSENSTSAASTYPSSEPDDQMNKWVASNLQHYEPENTIPTSVPSGQQFGVSQHASTSALTFQAFEPVNQVDKWDPSNSQADRCRTGLPSISSIINMLPDPEYPSPYSSSDTGQTNGANSTGTSSKLGAVTGFTGMEVFTILTKHLSPIKSHTLVLDVNGTYSCINIPEENTKIKLLFDENSGWELVTHAQANSHRLFSTLSTVAVKSSSERRTSSTSKSQSLSIFTWRLRL